MLETLITPNVQTQYNYIQLPRLMSASFADTPLLNNARRRRLRVLSLLVAGPTN